MDLVRDGDQSPSGTFRDPIEDGARLKPNAWPSWINSIAVTRLAPSRYGWRSFDPI
jgi:hypothetical protein